MRDREPIGGILLASEQSWTETDIIVSKRLAEIYSHALALLISEPRLSSQLTSKFLGWRILGLALVAIILAILAIPVSMTTLAPLEIAPRNPFIVAAPIEGVIKHVLVSPNEEVTKGQPILRFEDTILRNRLEIAEREVLVAEASLKKASQLAFNDKRGRHELGLAMAQYSLKTTELEFAREMFEQTKINAPRSGVILYSDKQKLIGKPVSIGERIMQIADPKDIAVEIDVPVSDAIVLGPNARVKFFLDSDPLFPREGKIELADYQARMRPGDILAFHVVARLTNETTEIPRLGVRGTAQLYGEDVPLVLYLFRRPLSALRQWIGI